jgi:hypothetical protein
MHFNNLKRITKCLVQEGYLEIEGHDNWKE